MPPIARAATAKLPTGETFGVTVDALEMIRAFGGTLHCFEGPVGDPGTTTGTYVGAPQPAFEDLRLSVGHGLSAKLDGAVLDSGNHNRMQRFVWLELPSAGNARCGCRRSFGARTGKRSPCLDKQAVGLTDL